MTIPDYACEIPCVPCRIAKECLEVIVPLGPWYPNREPDTLLKCGDSIPWPVVMSFGENIHGQIWCDEHGWQPPLTKKQIEAAKKKGRKHKEGQTFDDIPPF